ncbi:MAG: 2-oxo acid dehydrogenase subunit E2 [Deltaproteobacteria bacterium]|nr:2-oxo acid dehydrogenase subunit E2 [Deltaproteobacteria bacterium]
MIYELTMPKWGLTMEEGTILEWLVNEGEEVTPETEVLEVETDKSSQAIEVPAQGILRRIIVPAGETAPVGTLLAIIADPSVSDQEIADRISRSGDPGEEAIAVVEPIAEETHLPGQSPVTENFLPLSGIRTAIARTVTSGWTIPQFPVTIAIDMTKAENLYRRVKETGIQLSLNDLIIRAVAVALQKFPLANASFADDKYILHPEINISIAVGLADGLLMPVIKDCQKLSLQQLATRSRELIERARNTTTTEEDLSGGNFSISNLGMFGVEEFAALVPPGQAAILAVGAMSDEPIVKDGQVVVSRRMRVTLSADHRIVDGAYSAGFLAELKSILETAQALES